MLLRKRVNMLQRLHYLSRVLVGLDPYCKIQYRCSTKTFGSKYAKWTICPDKISNKSIVYSFGVGTDVSFDVEIIKYFGLRVHAFDPTPRSLKWIKTQDFPPKLKIYPWGIAEFNGWASFKEPHKSTHVSYRLTKKNNESKDSLIVYTLDKIMKKINHKRIDILKLDIEGAEYKVIESILKRKINIDQILVEFHHRFKDIDKEKTVWMIKQLNRYGYFIFYISECGTEFSFIRINKKL